MSVEDLRQKLKQLFGEQVVFNKEFDKFAENIKNIDQNLLEWCERLRKGEIKPEFGSMLGDHAYYDRLRKKLGIKQSS